MNRYEVERSSYYGSKISESESPSGDTLWVALNKAAVLCRQLHYVVIPRNVALKCAGDVRAMAEKYPHQRAFQVFRNVAFAEARAVEPWAVRAWKRLIG